MVEPAVLIAAAVASVAAVMLTPSLASAVRRGVRRSMVRRTSAAVLVVLTAIPARPAPVVATTPPPVLRIPLPVSPSGGGDPAGPSAVANDATVVRAPSALNATYVVEPGDCLWAIAARHLREQPGTDPSDAAVDRAWRHLYAENRQLIGDDPDLIFPGQTLTLPEEW